MINKKRYVQVSMFFLILIFIKNHSKRHIQSKKKTLNFSRARYARAFWGIISAFSIKNIDLGISKTRKSNKQTHQNQRLQV